MKPTETVLTGGGCMSQFTFSFDDSTRKRVETLRERTGAKTLAEIVRRALRAGLTTVETQEGVVV